MDVMRNTMRKWMLGTALVAGLLGTGVANAAPREFRGPGGHEYGRAYGHDYVRGYDRGFYRGGYERPGFGVAVGGPVVDEGYVDGYIPPCPGDGYIWLNGGWVFRGGARGYAYGRGYGGVAHFDRGRDFHGEGFRGEGFHGGNDLGYRGRR
jgi:hypothetical protein